MRRNRTKKPEVSRTGPETHMTSADVKLASDFEAATREHWLGLVDKVLKGGDFEKKARLQDGRRLRVEPIYTRSDALPEADATFPARPP